MEEIRVDGTDARRFGVELLQRQVLAIDPQRGVAVPGLVGDDEIDAIRTLRSGLHGFVALEAAGGFGLPLDVDRSFERLVDALVATLPSGR